MATTYTGDGNSMIPITYMPRKTVEETKYRALLNSVDLTNCCYFSYTYDLTSSIQRQEQFQCYEKSVQDMFVWNKSAIESLEYLEKECLAAGIKRPHTWVTHILHGSLQQKSADFQGSRESHEAPRRGHAPPSTAYLPSLLDGLATSPEPGTYAEE